MSVPKQPELCKFLSSKDVIPVEMRQAKRWLLFQLKPDKKTNKIKKVPVRAGQDNICKPFDSTNPKYWLTYDDAVKLLQTTDADGIGFALGDGFSGIDLDNCIDADGEVSEPAMRIVRKLNSYTEISPGEKGLHIIVKGKLPGGGRNTEIVIDDQIIKIELYDAGRYFTVTGHHLQGTPLEIYERQATLTEIYNSQPPTGKVTAKKVLSDKKIIDKLMRAPAIRNLYVDGDISKYNNDDSRADLALAGYLCRYSDDDEQVERLMRNTPLKRDKWDDRVDYLPQTIKTARQGEQSRNRQIDAGLLMWNTGTATLITKTVLNELGLDNHTNIVLTLQNYYSRSSHFDKFYSGFFPGTQKQLAKFHPGEDEPIKTEGKGKRRPRSKAEERVKRDLKKYLGKGGDQQKKGVELTEYIPGKGVWCEESQSYKGIPSRFLHHLIGIIDDVMEWNNQEDDHSDKGTVERTRLTLRQYLDEGIIRTFAPSPEPEQVKTVEDCECDIANAYTKFRDAFDGWEETARRAGWSEYEINDRRRNIENALVAERGERRRMFIAA